MSAQDFSSFLTIDEEEVDSPESSTAGAGAGAAAAAAAAAAVEHRKQRQEERERERQRRAALWLCSGGVVVFGCLSVIPVEFMLRRDPSAMEAITVSNYAFCVLEGLFSAGPAALLGARRIPLSVHAGIFFTALVYNVAQNKAVELGLGGVTHFYGHFESLLKEGLPYYPEDYNYFDEQAGTVSDSKDKPQVVKA